MPLRSSIFSSTLSGLATAFALLLAASTAAPAARPDETALLTLWEKHTQEPENHEALVQEANAFEQNHAKSPLVAVGRSLAAWHQLQAGNNEDARRLLGLLSTGGADPMSAAGREIAFRWLTRMDIEAVRKGLLTIFAETIAYPDTLAPVGNLPEAVRPPMADRWGAPWSYRLADFKLIKAGPKHHYVLQSAKLGDTSDLKKALSVPYGGASELKIDKILPAIGGKALVQISGKAVSKAVLGEGTASGDISFPYFGETLVVLSNGDYWVVLPKPWSKNQTSSF